MFQPKRRTKVLEVGNYAAGYAGKLFAHAGYDVVRVETEQRKACWVSAHAMDLFLHCDKRRIETANSDLLAELAKEADIAIVDGETADEIRALGFKDWDTNIKVAITPFGLTGPDRNRAATSATILALGGYTNLMGDSDREPLTMPGHYVDFQSGGYAYTAASACLLGDRQDTIDIGMLEVIMSLSQFTTVMWTCMQTVRSRHGNDFWSVVPTNLFRCGDGWVYINIVPGFWDEFTIFLGRPELTLDQRFRTNNQRMANRDALHEIIAGVLIHWTRSDIQQRAETARIPLGARLTFPEVLDDPHLRKRDVWQPIRQKNTTVMSPRPPFVMQGFGQRQLTPNDCNSTDDG